VTNASYSRSLIRFREPLYNKAFHSKKIDQINWLSFIDAWILLIAVAILSSAVSSPQTLDSKKLEASSSDFEVSVAQLKTPSKVWPHLRSAHRELSSGNVAQAAREVDRALRIDPECASALAMKAFIELAAKNPQEAVKHAGRAAEIDPHYAQSFVALAMAYNTLGDFQNAITAARQAVMIGPDFWQGRLELAKALYGQERFVSALRELDELNRDFPDVHLVRANILMRLNRPEEATIEFSQFLHEAPNDPRREQIQRIVNRVSAATSGPSHQ